MTYDEKHFDTAEELWLDLATPSTWRSDKLGWVFRGQRDHTWKLTPSAMRKGALDPFLPRGSVGLLRPILCEVYAVAQFALTSDEAGLDTVGGWQDLHEGVKESNQGPVTTLTLRATGKEIDEAKWPGRFAPIVALAQHSGVPTRLVDWTKRPEIAAYFAAASSLQADQNGSGRIAVWAANLQEIAKDTKGSNPRVDLIRVSRADNSRLHAQAGLFSVVTGEDPPPSLCQIPAAHKHLRKLTLPASEAANLMVAMKRHGVSESSLFPDYPGVVDEMKLKMIVGFKTADPDPWKKP